MPAETQPRAMAGRYSPSGGYFLMPEFYLWHDFRSAGPEAVGTYVLASAWATGRDWTRSFEPRDLSYLGCTQAGAERLAQAGLWKPSRNRLGFAEAVALRDLRKRRGHRGPILLLDQWLHERASVKAAGIAAFGAWALAASWSLANCQPGFVPHQAVAELGIEDQAEALWKPVPDSAPLWERDRGGYRMTLHDGCFRRCHWEVSRDDVRVPIPDDVRARVLALSGYRCVECGSPDDLALDHIYPWSRGGSDDEDNLQALCRPHNSRKRAIVPTAPATAATRREPKLKPNLPAQYESFDPDQCEKCGQMGEYALDQEGYVFLIDPKVEGGDFVALEDGNRIAWCRPAEPGAPLQPGEYLVSPHVCPVIPMARSDRRAASAR